MDNCPPLVSVHMITYNHAPYISRAIEGVLAQKTDFEFELVIGEDCSTDGTREIALAYQEAHPERVRVITSEKNVGMHANAKRTMDACRGRFIAWCEGDDYWHREDKLQRQVDYLLNHPDCGLVYTDYDCRWVVGGRLIRAFNRSHGLVPPDNPTMSDLLFKRCGIFTCTVCARLDLVREVYADLAADQDSSRFLMGDTQVWAGVLTKSRLHYLADSFATHNVLQESAAHSQSPLRQQKYYVSKGELLVHLARKYGLPQEEIEVLEHDLADAQLVLAFLVADRELAQSAWQRLTRKGIGRRLLLLGVQYRPLYAVVSRLREFKQGLSSGRRASVAAEASG